MDEVIYKDWEKKLERFNLSEGQLVQSCGDCSLTRLSANIIDPSEMEPFPGKYIAIMYRRVMSEERLRVVSPERTAEIMRSYPLDEMGQPGIRATDKRTSIGVDCIWREGSR